RGRPALARGRRCQRRDAVGRLGRVVGAPEPRAVRRQGTGGARPADCRARRHVRRGVRGLLHRGGARTGDGRFRAPGAQVTRSGAVAVAVALLATSAAVQGAWLRRAAPEEVVPAVRYLRSPEAARRLALSYDTLVADLYWMRALQVFGSTRLQMSGDKTYDGLYQFLDIATSLDPQ